MKNKCHFIISIFNVDFRFEAGFMIYYQKDAVKLIFWLLSNPKIDFSLLFYQQTHIIDLKSELYIKNWYNKVTFIFHLREVMFRGLLLKLSGLSEAGGNSCCMEAKFCLSYFNQYTILQLSPSGI